MSAGMVRGILLIIALVFAWIGAGEIKKHHFRLTFALSLMATILTFAFARDGSVNAIAKMTGGKPLSVITAAEKTAHEESEKAREAKRLQRERDVRATTVIDDIWYAKNPRVIGEPICVMMYRNQPVNQVNCKVAPPELLGIADPK
jgi:hypothetical protein